MDYSKEVKILRIIEKEIYRGFIFKYKSITQTRTIQSIAAGILYQLEKKGYITEDKING